MKIKLLSLVACLLLASASANAAVVFGIKTAAGPDEADPSNPPTLLFSVNNGVVSTLGNVQVGGANVDADALAVNAAGDLYAYQILGNGASSQLISIDPNSPQTSTAIGIPLVGVDARGATFDGSSLLVLDETSNSILTINPATGAVLSTLALSGADVFSASDIAVDSQGTLYLSTRNVANTQATIYTVDQTTGALTLVGQTAGKQFAGLAFDGDDSVVMAYQVNGFPDNIEVRNLDGTLSLDSTIGLPGVNSGRGDLANAPVPEPGSILIWGVLLSAVGFAKFGRRKQS